MKSIIERLPEDFHTRISEARNDFRELRKAYREVHKDLDNFMYRFLK